MQVLAHPTPNFFIPTAPLMVSSRDERQGAWKWRKGGRELQGFSA